MVSRNRDILDPLPRPRLAPAIYSGSAATATEKRIPDVQTDNTSASSDPATPAPPGRAAKPELSASQRWTAEEGARLVAPSDVQKLAVLAALAPMALLPQRVGNFWTGVLANMLARLMPARAASRAGQIPTGLVDLSGRSADEIARAQETAYLVALTEFLRSVLFPGWRPQVRMLGCENLLARPAGRGAIFWIERSGSSSLMTKAALASEGIEITHLSRPSHGLSNTRFGMRFLNGLLRTAESRYIAGRVTIRHGSPNAALRELRSVLLEGGAVTVTVGDMAQKLVEADCLAGRLRVSTGPAHLARSTGSAVYPVFSWREADGSYAVQVDAPLDVSAGDPRAFGLVAAEYARRLELYVEAHPLDWTGWQLGNYVED